MRRSIVTKVVAAFVLAAPTVVLAHSQHATASDFAVGFTHPITGIDHVLAMIATGVLAAQLGRRALWLVPLAFVALMMIGGAVGMAEIYLPFAELVVAASVVMLGLVIAFPSRLETLTAVALVSFFALFHGYVHGAEIPLAASMLSYTAGFVVATALLHLIGVKLGLRFASQANGGLRIARASGGAMALCGITLLAGFI